MEIGATKAVQDRLKTTKIEESKGASLVFCWDTHLTKIKGRNVLFIVNASNRYTIAMTDIEQGNWNYYTMYISRVILNNPASVSMLSGLRKPQIRF